MWSLALGTEFELDLGDLALFPSGNCICKGFFDKISSNGFADPMSAFRTHLLHIGHGDKKNKPG